MAPTEGGVVGSDQAWEEAFVAYYVAKGEMLRRTAFALCGDWHLAEDLTQSVFTNLYRAWQRVERHEVLDQYARRVLLRAFLDQGRRPWRRESPTAPESPAFDGAEWEDRTAEDRLALQAALMSLPKRRRAVLVLRYWADLSVEQVAEVLKCPPGTVKSMTARGLADLRARLGSALDEVRQSGEAENAAVKGGGAWTK
jgi:RNA polymerase sigma-70 factor (sigma-E family)